MIMRTSAFFFLVFSLTAQDRYPTGYRDTPVLPGQQWKVHDADRPRPPKVDTSGRVPSDAIVLFDGKDLSQWTNGNRPITWKVENGYVEVAGTGGLRTKEKFGDIQLHLEWASPAKIEHASQDRGNSGVILMRNYEVQVLDSWENPTYADGQAGAMYGQYPPLVNAARKPGEWQTYDIIFRAPKFENGKMVRPAYVTVLHNGVLLHDHQAFIGRMEHRKVGQYSAHGDEEPLELQNHNCAVRYRNIWVRRLKGYDAP
jgi:hypothetical protein